MRLRSLLNFAFAIETVFLLLFGSPVSTSFSSKKELEKISDSFDFVISASFLEQIVPRDETRSVFVFPPEPSRGLLMKLVNKIDSMSKKLGIMSYMVRQYTHYDLVSIRFFSRTIESFITLADLHNSIMKSDSFAYEIVISSVKEMTRVLLNFLRTFTSSLLISRLSECSAFKSIILDEKALYAMFYLLKHRVITELQSEILIDAIFSAVGSQEDEIIAWSFYSENASPSVCISLPFEFWTHRVNSHWIISDELVKIFMKGGENEDFDYAWLTQLGLIMRFRLLNSDQIIQLAEVISSKLEVSQKADLAHLRNFTRLAFVNELVRPVPVKEALNLTTERPAEADTFDFYVTLWNLIVPKCQISIYEYEEFESVIFSLEKDFPQISAQLATGERETVDLINGDVESARFVSDITDFIINLSTAEGIEDAINFVREKVKDQLSQFKIVNIRERLRCIHEKLLNLIKAIEHSSVDDPTSLKTLIKEIGEKFILISNFINVFPEVSGTAEIELLVDFAFKLEDLEDAELFCEFLYDRFENDEQNLSIFFKHFSENLINRQYFFCLKLERKSFLRLNRRVFNEFLQSIKDIQITENFVVFFTTAYLNGAVERELLFYFIESIKNSDLSSVDGVKALNVLVCNTTEISFFEFNDNNSFLEFYDAKFAEIQANSVKLLDVLVNLRNDAVRAESDLLILPWLCSKISSFETLKIEISPKDQIKSLIIEHDMQKNIRASVMVLLKVLQNGASKDDLKKIVKFIFQFRDSVTKMPSNHPSKNLSVAVAFTISILAIRTDESLVSVDFAESIMKNVRLSAFRISAPQLVYKAFKNGQSRSYLIPTFAEMSFNRQDYGLLLDPNFFAGMDQKTVRIHLNYFLKAAFTSQGIERLFLEVFCHWMGLGIVPLDLAHQIVELVSKSSKKRSIAVTLSISIIRAIFKRAEYRSLRQMTVRLLFVETDHTYISPHPFSMGILGGVNDFFNEPEFLSAIKEEKSPNSNSSDIHALVNTETVRLNRVTREALDLCDGIENVFQTYTAALAQLGSFEMTLTRKILLLNSIFRSLKRFNSTDGDSDQFGLEHIDLFLDNFVRTAIYLAVHIYSDITAPCLMYDLEAESIETFMESIIRYVRESNVQGLLVFHLFTIIKERRESRAAILEIVPRFINWRRFLLIPDTFRFIFNFNDPEFFEKFMYDAINGAFRFEDLSENDAIDMSRDDKQIQMIHECFFATMASLISEYNLPVKYIIFALDNMIFDFDRIEVISNHLVQFLCAAIRNRQIDRLSSVFRITSKSYGKIHDNTIYNSQKDVVTRVLEFLRKRPDFLSMALVNSPNSEPYKFMLELEIVAIGFPAYQLPQIQLIRSMFSFPSTSGIENLKLIGSSVQLPNHTIRGLATWLISSFSRNLAPQTIQITLIVLNLCPETFTMESFLDSSFSHSWYDISKVLINWIAKLCTDYHQQFAISVDESGVEKFLNILQWRLEYDVKEELVSSALNAFLTSLCGANDSVKYHFIHSLTKDYYRPLTGQVRRLDNLYNLTCSHFRRWTIGNSSLAVEVEKLIFAFVSDELITADEDLVMSTRSSFLLKLAELEIRIKENQIGDFNVLFSSLSDYVPKLRLMREVDLILKFISILAELACLVYPQIPTEDTENLATSLGLSIIFLRSELLLQSNRNIFVDFFKFLFKHSGTEKNSQYFQVIQTILSQIHSSENIQNVQFAIISDMRLESCLIPSAGLPDQFYEESSLSNSYLDSYIAKMNQLGTSNRRSGKIEMDGHHFIHIFNCGHNSNASDGFFMEWAANISRIRGNDIFTINFTQNLKAHCLARKHLIPQLIPVFINPSFIQKLFTSADKQSKENLIAVFKLIMMNNPKLYQDQVEKLPENLQRLMNESVGASLNEKRLKLISELVKTCNLPNEIGFKFADVMDLQVKLETLAKLDLSLLLSEQVSIFFRRLDILIEGLVNLETDRIGSLKIIVVALMIQLRHGTLVNPRGLLLVFRGHLSLDLSDEAITLFLKAISAPLNYEFTSSDATSIAVFALKSLNPTKHILDCLKNVNLKCHVVIFMKTILKSKHPMEIELLMQNLILDIISNNRKDPNLVELFKLAVSHKLLSKSLILSIQKILK